MKRLIVTLALALTVFAAPVRAYAADPADVLSVAQLCANAPFPEAVDAHAVRERWWQLDEARLEALRSASDLSSTAERGWLWREQQVVLTFTTNTTGNDRLAALSEPFNADDPVQSVMACTVYGTRTDVAEVLRRLPAISLLGQQLGVPTDGIALDDDLRSNFWAVRGQGEVAYVFTRSRQDSIIIEIGRIAGGDRPAE